VLAGLTPEQRTTVLDAFLLQHVADASPLAS